MRVVIVGAGIGGLVLGQALHRAGLDVVVLERDDRLDGGGGYRLHLGELATGILGRVLPAPVFEAVRASSAGPRAFRQFALLDHELRTLARLPQTGDHLMIGRSALRQLLGRRLDGVLRPGHEFSGWQPSPDGQIVAHCTNDVAVTADVLVGADGTYSRVVAGLTDRSPVRLLQAAGIAGWVPLSGEVRRTMPEELSRGPAFCLGPAGMSVFLTLHDPGRPGVVPDEEPVVESPALLWGLVTSAGRIERSATDSLHQQAVASVARWSPAAARLVAAADPATVSAFPYLAADPARELVPWPAGPVTALGDAVHAMPPTGGQGAATAIRDADLLARQLIRAARGEVTITGAVDRYQRELTSYAPQAVRDSLAPLAWQTVLSRPLVYPAVRGLGAAGRLVRRTGITRGHSATGS